jgi:NTP pyrophosphatase (non-canonical NTP hydrolase)
MTITELQQQVDHWIKTIGVRYFGELTNTAILTEEVGEVARLMSRIYGEQSFKNPTSPEDAKAMLADEMADVLWVLTCLANQTGINLEEAMQKNIEKKTLRDINRHVDNKKINP